MPSPARRGARTLLGRTGSLQSDPGALRARHCVSPTAAPRRYKDAQAPTPNNAQMICGGEPISPRRKCVQMAPPRKPVTKIAPSMQVRGIA